MHLPNNIITRDPEVLGGGPAFRGTRVPFQALIDYRDGGQTLDEFLDDFPSVSREAAVRALEHAYSLVADETHFLDAVDAGIAAAQRGEFEEVLGKLKRILES